MTSSSLEQLVPQAGAGPQERTPTPSPRRAHARARSRAGVRARTSERGFCLLCCLSLLAGSFRFSRLDPRLAVLGWADYLAIWVVLATLSFATYLAVYADGRFAIPAKVPVNRWGLASAAFLVYAAISHLWSPGVGQDYGSALALIITAMLIAVFGTFFHGPRLRLRFRTLIGYLYAISLAYLVAGLTAAGSGERIAAFAGGPNVFVRIMGTGLIAALYLWRSERRAIWLLPTPLFLLAALMSGSRGGIVAIGVSALLLGLGLIRTPRGAVRLLAVAGMVGYLFFMVVLLSPDLSAFLSQRYIDLTVIQRYTSGREARYEAAWQLFLQRPIAGHGLHGYSQLTRFNYPHNLFLHVGAEMGIIGLVLLGVLLFSVAKRWFRPRSMIVLFAGALGVLFFTASMFSGDLYDTRMMWFFWTIYMIPLQTLAVSTATVRTSEASGAG